jgi:5-methyltetrahydropteroyltriglutamate--homocysteine methyltransferase
MLRTTADILLPTTVTGSWPRPDWYTANLGVRSFSAAMLDVAYREQFVDAANAVVSDQERAGLDILTNGDYHIDRDLGGGSWVSYPVLRLAGLAEHELVGSDFWRFSSRFAGLRPEAAPSEAPFFPVGTWLNEIVSGWRYPAVVGRLGPRVPLEFAKIWRVAQSWAERPVKFGTVAADIVGGALTLRTEVYDQDKRELMWDIATVLNGELRALAAAGCRAIQIEDPLVYYLASLGADQETLDFHVDLFNHQVEGLEEVEIWIHTCWGNAGSQRSASPGYDAACLEIMLERLRGDIWTIESKDSRHSPLPLFARYKGALAKNVAVGFVSHRTVNVESPEEIAADVRYALQFIDAERLVLSTDCGFGRQGVSRPVALYKAAALAQAANIIRKELGVPERPVPAADPRYQIDEPLVASAA